MRKHSKVLIVITLCFIPIGIPILLIGIVARIIGGYFLTGYTAWEHK